MTNILPAELEMLEDNISKPELTEVYCFLFSDLQASKYLCEYKLPENASHVKEFTAHVANFQLLLQKWRQEKRKAVLVNLASNLSQPVNPSGFETPSKQLPSSEPKEQAPTSLSKRRLFANSSPAKQASLTPAKRKQSGDFSPVVKKKTKLNPAAEELLNFLKSDIPSAFSLSEKERQAVENFCKAAYIADQVGECVMLYNQLDAAFIPLLLSRDLTAGLPMLPTTDLRKNIHFLRTLFGAYTTYIFWRDGVADKQKAETAYPNKTLQTVYADHKNKFIGWLLANNKQQDYINAMRVLTKWTDFDVVKKARDALAEARQSQLYDKHLIGALNALDRSQELLLELIKPTDSQGNKSTAKLIAALDQLKQLAAKVSLTQEFENFLCGQTKLMQMRPNDVVGKLLKLDTSLSQQFVNQLSAVTDLCAAARKTRVAVQKKELGVGTAQRTTRPKKEPGLLNLRKSQLSVAGSARCITVPEDYARTTEIVAPASSQTQTAELAKSLPAMATSQVLAKPAYRLLSTDLLMDEKYQQVTQALQDYIKKCHRLGSSLISRLFNSLYAWFKGVGGETGYLRASALLTELKEAKKVDGGVVDEEELSVTLKEIKTDSTILRRRLENVGFFAADAKCREIQPKQESHYMHVGNKR